MLPQQTSPFDQIRHEDEQGEWWSARELAKLLKYGRYDDFLPAIEKAREDCENAGRDPEEQMRKLPQKSSGGRPASDIRLTAYACRLIVMAARTRDSTIASLARTYFSDKVAQAEQEDVLLGDPEEWLERAIRSYMARGYSEAYARNRIDSILARNRLTGQWVLRGIMQEEIPILTDRLHMGTFDISVEEHKGIKQFPLVRRGRSFKHKGNLRPALTPMELAVLTFSENVTAALHEERDSRGFPEISRDVADGSAIAKDKRLEIESTTGQPVVSPRNMITEPDGGLWQALPAPQGDNS